MAKKLFLLDGMGLLYRAHFALIRNPVRTTDGTNVSGIFGFLNTLLEIRDKEKPDILAVAWDREEPTKRHEIFTDYKANRQEIPEDIADSIAPLKEILRAMGIAQTEKAGYEADDLMGTFAREMPPQDYEVHLVTRDKDLAQLVGEHVFIYRPGIQGAPVEIWDSAKVCEHFGVASPSGVIDYLALVGDSVDNIPGIPGIGEKTAKKLLSQYQSLEGLLENAAEIKGKMGERIRENAAQARLSYQLATIDCQVPLEDEERQLTMPPFDATVLEEWFRRYELNTLGKRVLGQDFTAGRAAARLGLSGHEPAPTSPPEELETMGTRENHYREIQTMEDWESFRQDAIAAGVFALDTETASLDVICPDLIGISLSTGEGSAWFLGEDFIKTLHSPLADFLRQRKGPMMVGHNLKYDLQVLMGNGFEVNLPVFDTMVAHAILEPNQKQTLDFLAESLLGYKTQPLGELIQLDKKGKKPKASKGDLFDGDSRQEEELPSNLREVPRQKLVNYACEDADIALRLYHHLEPKIEASGQKNLLHQVEFPLIPVLAYMERVGVRLDVESLKIFEKDLTASMSQKESQLYDLAGEIFNLNSPKQLGEILFEKLRIVEKPKKTPSGQYATSENILQSLANVHPLPAGILEYRGMAKLLSTYAAPLPSFVHPKSNRIHPSFSQTVTATGRLACANPNLQNIPVRTEEGRRIRQAFTASSTENLLLRLDYSQIELRVFAAMSKDPGMTESFLQDQDIHQTTAARVFGVALDQVDSAMRRTAKMVNFGILYGISAFGLAQRLGCSRSEAADIIGKYQKQFPAVTQTMESLVAEGQKNGYVQTLNGRRRYLPDLNSANATIRQAAERMAINTPIQGTAAEIIKLAMIDIHHWLQESAFPATMVLQIHDELVFDTPSDKVEECRQAVTPLMENAMKLPEDLPLKVDGEATYRWSEK